MSQGPKTGRFVVLEHERDGVHWDFMLEAGELLRTWAIDAPIVPGVDLPARALADHRRIYLTYEGPISGGRGTVRRVAEGTFRTLEWEDDRVYVRLEGDQLVGEVYLYRSGSSTALDSSMSSAGEIGEPWKFRLGKVD